ncbi:hypothetical protein [Actinomadura sp. HBU206391]|uniref:hypothetical protein n=1 Tax=Actinomadura sp. HBU206391 TaxID=2731692 RepID=UPI00164FF88C|nr:hypothetical protein [Actinomadura sp. HBU206391]MBC6463530.1 hypothetical protein [Actinomadura sp. HBU206391]
MTVPEARLGGGPLAAHSAVSAIPFFVPTIVVVAVIVVVIWRDRRRHPVEDTDAVGADPDGPDPRSGPRPGD